MNYGRITCQRRDLLSTAKRSIFSLLAYQQYPPTLSPSTSSNAATFLWFSSCTWSAVTSYQQLYHQQYQQHLMQQHSHDFHPVHNPLSHHINNYTISSISSISSVAWYSAQNNVSILSPYCFPCAIRGQNINIMIRGLAFVEQGEYTFMWSKHCFNR